MPESLTLLVWTASIFIIFWSVRWLMKDTDDSRKDAAQSHIYAVLQREKCEAILAECREIRAECHIAAAAAHDAAADAEEFAESGDIDDDDEEAEWR